MTPPIIDIREQFAQCVRKMGGLALDDTLEGHPKNPTNADYVFPKDNVVAELKCLEQDRNDSFEANGKALIRDWIRRGKIAAPKSGSVLLADLPTALQREILKPVRNRLKVRFGIAGRQLKQTRLDHGLPDAKGLLLLANDGNFLYEPDMMAHLAASILRSPDNSAIHSVIYFSADVKVAATPMKKASFWIPWSRGASAVPAEFMDRIRDAWMAHLSVVTQAPVYEFPGDDIYSTRLLK